MWATLLLIWSVPLAAAILIFARLGDGRPALNDKEAKFLLGDSDRLDLSPWRIFEFVIIALGLFVLGVFEGLVLPNFGALWLVAAAVPTGIAAMAIVAYRLRSATPGRAGRARALPRRAGEPHRRSVHTLNFLDRR